MSYSVVVDEATEREVEEEVLLRGLRGLLG
jgi:hypothetical protein